MIKHRGVLAALLGLGGFGLLALAPADADAQSRRPTAYGPASGYSGFAVDASPLLAKGGGRPAALVAEALRAELPRAFAARGTQGRVVVRLTGLSLSPFVGQGAGVRSLSGGGENDYLEGELLLVDGRGAVVAAKPLLTVLPASPNAAYPVPEVEPRRLQALAANFAGWAARSF